MSLSRNKILKNLQQIPGVGQKIAEDLWNLGIRKVSDLKNRNPEQLYVALCGLAGNPVDRCMLYVFRCAVYYASSEEHAPELLRWWNWSDSKMNRYKSVSI